MVVKNKMVNAIGMEQLTCCINGCNAQALFLVFTSRACDCEFSEVMKLCLACKESFSRAVDPDNDDARVTCTGCNRHDVTILTEKRIQQT